MIIPLVLHILRLRNTSSIDLEPAHMPHHNNFLNIAFRKAEPAWGRGEEHCIFTKQIGAEGEDIVGL